MPKKQNKKQKIRALCGNIVHAIGKEKASMELGDRAIREEYQTAYKALEVLHTFDGKIQGQVSKVIRFNQALGRGDNIDFSDHKGYLSGILELLDIECRQVEQFLERVRSGEASAEHLLKVVEKRFHHSKKAFAQLRRLMKAL